MNELIPMERIESKIFIIRGQKVMIDRDLAKLYEVETKYLNRQVRRNRKRFPKEFMFQLNRRERGELVTNCHRFDSLKHSSSFPFAFTEHGVAMLAGILKSKKAIDISIYIVKAFIALKKYIYTHKEFAKRLNLLEQKHKKHDVEIETIFEAIKQLIKEEEQPKKRFGFQIE